MNAPELITASAEDDLRTHSLLGYYEAIEQASQDMLEAARTGDWDTVVRLEGACAVLIAQLKHAASVSPLPAEEIALKGRIMQRILRNDAEIRNLAEPWINELSRMTGHPDGERLH
ncbi:MAG: flagellar protein FliT [Pseudomonadota bacterium]|jgi:flagellar protein FliT|uniref:flagellar protein FliT n=1 Tax=Aquabacterium sp. TaxID=1872578 RepID=UPI003BAEBA0D